MGHGSSGSWGSWPNYPREKACWGNFHGINCAFGSPRGGENLGQSTRFHGKQSWPHRVGNIFSVASSVGSSTSCPLIKSQGHHRLSSGETPLLPPCLPLWWDACYLRASPSPETPLPSLPSWYPLAISTTVLFCSKLFVNFLNFYWILYVFSICTLKYPEKNVDILNFLWTFRFLCHLIFSC